MFRSNEVLSGVVGFRIIYGTGPYICSISNLQSSIAEIVRIEHFPTIGTVRTRFMNQHSIRKKQLQEFNNLSDDTPGALGFCEGTVIRVKVSVSDAPDVDCGFIPIVPNLQVTHFTVSGRKDADLIYGFPSAQSSIGKTQLQFW
jgi:hypothetical protein